MKHLIVFILVHSLVSCGSPYKDQLESSINEVKDIKHVIIPTCQNIVSETCLDNWSFTENFFVDVNNPLFQTPSILTATIQLTTPQEYNSIKDVLLLNASAKMLYNEAKRGTGCNVQELSFVDKNDHETYFSLTDITTIECVKI
ncbi:hypothetical protein OAB57_01745 [Bacteriovoracaceae bacterium]|nr:hypothetical protein [Bacteriovoracaceae bacterium]